MAAFRYEALDTGGRATTGVIESDSPRQARDQLRGRGLLPVAVEPLSGAEIRRDVAARARTSGLSRFQLALITRQFATLLGAGLTVEQALAALGEQAHDATERERLAQVRSEVLSGHGLAAAFTAAGFPELYCALVAAGERSGRLEAVMQKLADYVERREQARARILQALIYPAVVALVAAAVVAALLGYVVPQLVAVFESTRQTLPWPTRALIAVSGFIRSSGWFWLTLAVAGIAAYSWMLARSGLRSRMQSALLRLPLVGPLLTLSDTARFASALSILTGSGVPILAALEAAAGTLRLLPLRAAVARAADAVGEGVALSQALQAAGMFPPLLIHLIANGEATGGLEHALDGAARAADAELGGRTAIALSLIEPALIVALGLFVLGIVIAVLLPVVEINQLLGAPR
jgi:general secretion pathway protein F